MVRPVTSPTCLACGHAGADVRMRIVEHDDPITVQVTLPGADIVTVPGRYGSEWRCTDQLACDGRQLVTPPAVADDEWTSL